MQQLSWRFRALALLYHAAFTALVGGPVAVLLGARHLGAYLMVAGFATRHLVHRIFAAVGVHESEPLGGPVAGAGYAIAIALLLGGLFAAIAGAPVGAYLLLGGFGVQLSADLTLGLLGYRDTMRRPWPRVAPIVDDDDS